MLMMLLGELPSIQEKKLQHSAFTAFFRKTRENGFMILWEEFEAYETPEAKYAHMLDNSQPLFLNNATDGISWVEHGVKKSQIYTRNRRTGEGAPKIWEYMQELIDQHVEKGHVIDDMSKKE